MSRTEKLQFSLTILMCSCSLYTRKVKGTFGLWFSHPYIPTLNSQLQAAHDISSSSLLSESPLKSSRMWPIVRENRQGCLLTSKPCFDSIFKIEPELWEESWKMLKFSFWLLLYFSYKEFAVTLRRASYIYIFFLLYGSNMYFKEHFEAQTS